MKICESKFIFLILQVHDILFATNNFDLLRESKKYLYKNFKRKEYERDNIYDIGI